jgi:SAM-dependent methyltransferase
MTNEAQISHWAGEGGEQWVADHERYDRLLAPYGRRVVGALDQARDARVLDVGCGNGALTREVAAKVPNGTVTGVDISTPMLAFARRQAAEAGLGNVRFLEADAQVHAFEPGSFDAVVSRFGVMFFDDPEAAFANIGAAVRPGGQLVFVCWRELLANEWMAVPVGAALQHVPMPALPAAGAPGPFAFADPDKVRAVVAAGGFGDIALEEVDEQEPIGASVDEVLRFLGNSEMARTLFDGVDDDVADRAWAAVADALAAHETRDGIVLGGAAWLVTARRR